MPAVGRFARPEPHLRSFAFWNTHGVRLSDFELVERCPDFRRWSFIARGRSIRGTVHARADFPSNHVATRMGRKGEEDVFPYRFRQIDFLMSVEFQLTREVSDPNR